MLTFDKRILRLIAKWLKVGTVEDGRFQYFVAATAPRAFGGNN
jgi:hypothetical protein